MVRKESFLKYSDNLQTQGFKILADFLSTSGKTITMRRLVINSKTAFWVKVR